MSDKKILETFNEITDPTTISEAMAEIEELLLEEEALRKLLPKGTQLTLPPMTTAEFNKKMALAKEQISSTPLYNEPLQPFVIKGLK